MEQEFKHQPGQQKRCQYQRAGDNISRRVVQVNFVFFLAHRTTSESVCSVFMLRAFFADAMADRDTLDQPTPSRSIKTHPTGSHSGRRV
jgi:hypothetical protein